MLRDTTESELIASNWRCFRCSVWKTIIYKKKSKPTWKL